MKLGKFLLAIVFIILIGGLWFVFLRDDNDKLIIQNQMPDDFKEYREGLRGDDPLYSEEIRKNAAITLQTQQKQSELEEKIQQELISLNREANEKNKELRRQLDELNRQLKSVQSQDAMSDVGSEVKALVEGELNTLTKQLKDVQEALVESKENSKKRIQELEETLQQRLADTEINKPDEDELKTESKRRSPYGSAAMTLPYGRNGVELNQVDNKLGDENDLFSTFGQGIDEATGALSNTLPERDNNLPKSYLPQVAPNRSRKWETVFPVYTIPPNSILADAKLVTPLIGRVPYAKSNIKDPFFFKVEVGANNLAANGHSIPGIAKIIASGYATGIGEQKCARGYIDSLTFIFIDGRIVNQGKASQEGSSNSDAIGYLADRWGKPCLTGEYINNAGDYLKSRGMASFIEAAAQGLAQSQTTTRRNSDGSRNTYIDGDIWKVVLGQGISGSAAEVADYVRERTANAFDVVYVEQGRTVQIMIDQMVPIDYDANARKISYYNDKSSNPSYD